MMYAELKRTCRRCNEIRPLEEFYYKTLSKEGRCKPCVSELRKQAYKHDSNKIVSRVTLYRRANPEKIRDTKLKQAYGVGLDWFNAKLVEQNFGCAGCGNPESTIWRGRVLSLAVDHDHITGQNRGLLCMRCNRAMGMLDENPKTLRNLLEYISKFKK